MNHHYATIYKLMLIILFVLMFSCSEQSSPIGNGDDILEYDSVVGGDDIDISSADIFEYGDLEGQELFDIGDSQITADINSDVITDTGFIRSPQLIINKEYLPLLTTLIKGANNNILILTQEFLSGSTLDQLQNEIIDAKKRGVDVHILLEKDVNENATRVQSLKANGVDASLDTSSKTLHLKLVLVDNKHLLLGSTNLSYSSFQYNNEANIYISDDEVINKFYDYANSVLSDNNNLYKIYCSSCRYTPIGDGQYADLVVPLINRTRENLFIIMYQFSYDTDTSTPNGRITMSIVDAKSRGVNVKLLLEYSSFDSTLNSTNQKTADYLKNRGIDVRLDSKEVVTHAKLLIADDIVVVYSGNWVYSALKSNHEVGIIINDPAINEKAVNYFNALFNSAK